MPINNYNTRSVYVINKVVFHCSACDNLGPQFHAVRKCHMSRGWYDVGYNFFIERDGTVIFGRSIGIVGAHCLGQNEESIGICLAGNKIFNEIQFQKAKALVSFLELLPGLDYLTIHGHNEFNKNKTCPNFDIDRIMKAKHLH